MHRFFVLFSLFIALFPAHAQRRIDARHVGERILAIVPMTGAGTPTDPRRPMFAPLPNRPVPPRSESFPEILAFSYQLSDDGRFALVEFVARDRRAFANILNAGRPDVKVFDKSRSTRAEVEAEFRKYKRDFDFSNLGAVLP